MKMNEKQWEKKWAKKLEDLPEEIVTLDQIFMILDSAIDRYSYIDKPADEILWSNFRENLARVVKYKE